MTVLQSSVSGLICGDGSCIDDEVAAAFATLAWAAASPDSWVPPLPLSQDGSGELP